VTAVLKPGNGAADGKANAGHGGAGTVGVLTVETGYAGGRGRAAIAGGAFVAISAVQEALRTGAPGTCGNHARKAKVIVNVKKEGEFRCQMDQVPQTNHPLCLFLYRIYLLPRGPGHPINPLDP